MPSNPLDLQARHLCRPSGEKRDVAGEMDRREGAVERIALIVIKDHEPSAP